MIKRILLIPILAYFGFVTFQIDKQHQSTLNLLEIVSVMAGIHLSESQWKFIFIFLGIVIITGFRYATYSISLLITILMFIHLAALNDLESTQISIGIKIVAAEIGLVGILLLSTQQSKKNNVVIEDSQQIPKEKED